MSIRGNRAQPRETARLSEQMQNFPGGRERQELDPAVCLKESGTQSCPRVPVEEKGPDSVGLFQ